VVEVQGFSIKEMQTIKKIIEWITLWIIEL